jgi:hypothetical protein
MAKLDYSELVEFEGAAKSGLSTRVSKLTNAQSAMQTLAATVNFKGDTAVAINNYLAEVHGALIAQLLTVEPLMSGTFSQYVAGYPAVDEGGVSFKLSTDDYGDLKEKIGKKDEAFKELAETLKTADSLAAEGGVGAETSSKVGDIRDKFTQMEKIMSTQESNWSSYEGGWAGALDSTGELIDQIMGAISSYSGKGVPSMTTYVAGDFNQAVGVDYMQSMQQAWEFENNSDFIHKTKQAKKILKEVRAEYQAQQNSRTANLVLNVGFLLVSGAATIFSLGTAAPVFWTSFVAFGFQASNASESIDNAWTNGKSNFNPIREFGFNKNQQAYDVANLTLSVAGSGGAYKALVKKGVFVASKSAAKPLFKTTALDFISNGTQSAGKSFVSTFKSNAKVNAGSLLPKFTSGYTVQKVSDFTSVYGKETGKKWLIKELDKSTRPVISNTVAPFIADGYASKGTFTNEMIKQSIEMKAKPASFLSKSANKVFSANKTYNEIFPSTQFNVFDYHEVKPILGASK